MKFLNIVLVGLTLALHATGYGLISEQAVKDGMKRDLDVIHNTFEVYYAPKEWKKTQFGWDLASEIQKAKDKVQSAENITIKKFQYIVRDFFHSTKDYHVGVRFISTETGTLPFSIKASQGRYFVSYVNSSQLDQSVFPLFVGDEIVEFDHRPIAEVMNELREAFSSNSNLATDEQMTAFYLTHRSGQLGHYVPKGRTAIAVKSFFSDELKTVDLIWNYTPEKISNGFNGSLLSMEEDKLLNKTHRFDKLMVMPGYEIMKDLYHKSHIKAYDDDDDDEDEDSEHFIGSRKSALPTLGRIWWESSPSSYFQAYIYETIDHKLVGFVRIPDYMGGSWAVDEFVSIISFFEERTEALVIDQMNNPGGSLLYAYGLLSTLTDKPLLLPKERVTITQDDVSNAIEAISLLEMLKSNSDAQDIFGYDIAGLPVTYQTIQYLLEYFRFIVSEWDAGRKFTDSCYLLGFDKILPHPQGNYTKPILLLVNSLDFSCGDYFPAVLQDNKRATILGARTAGAGGFVLGSFFPNSHGIGQFSLTGSIAERLDTQPIENLGVTPDIEYQFSNEDILFGYDDFADKINITLYNLY